GRHVDTSFGYCGRHILREIEIIAAIVFDGAPERGRLDVLRVKGIKATADDFHPCIIRARNGCPENAVLALVGGNGEEPSGHSFVPHHSLCRVCVEFTRGHLVVIGAQIVFFGPDVDMRAGLIAPPVNGRSVNMVVADVENRRVNPGEEREELGPPASRCLKNLNAWLEAGALAGGRPLSRVGASEQIDPAFLGCNQNLVVREKYRAARTQIDIVRVEVADIFRREPRRDFQSGRETNEIAAELRTGHERAVARGSVNVTVRIGRESVAGLPNAALGSAGRGAELCDWLECAGIEGKNPALPWRRVLMGAEGDVDAAVGFQK